MSKREELRKKRQQATRQQQLLIISAVALAAIAIAAVVIWPNLQPAGEVATPEARNYAFAAGKALGPSNAKVLIEEFSDFQ